MNFLQKLVVSALSFSPITAAAAESAVQTQGSAARSGVSAIWILANVSYAGMRAQNSRSTVWRIVAFIFGFPGTLISFLAVREGSEKAYGIEVPRRRPPGSGA